MDQKLFKSYDKDLMKMEMLKHEKIFKEQVHELHRLYRVQKLLMSNMEAGTTRQPTRQDQEMRWIPRRHQIKGLCKSDQQNEEQNVANSNCTRGIGLIDESEIQLTLGPSVYTTSSNSHHQKRPSSGQSLSSSNYSARREDCGWNFAPSTKNGRQMNLGEEHLRQERMEKHPPWLFQALSLKLT